MSLTQPAITPAPTRSVAVEQGSTLATVVFLGLLLGGLGFLVLARSTPWHSDSRAYFAALQKMEADQVYGREASQAFYDLLHRYRTNKWVYADIGYLLVGWSLPGLAVTTLVRHEGWGAVIRTCCRPVRLLVLAAAALVLMWVGLCAHVSQEYGRELLPPWADSVAIPLYAFSVMTAMLTPIVLLLVTGPLLLRPCPGEPIFVMTKGPHWPAGLATLLYLPLLALAGLVALNQPGGWATSVAGAILTWLALNARAMLIGAKWPKSKAL